MNFAEIYKEIGARIVFYRRLKHLTQAELAEKAGLSVSYLSRIERGVYVSGVPISTFIKIARAMDIKVSCLLKNLHIS